MAKWESKTVEALERITNQIVVLSGGALVLSVTLVDKFGSKGLYKWAIVVAWISFGISILCGLGSNWTNAIANYCIQFLGEYGDGLKQNNPNEYNKFTKNRDKYLPCSENLEIANQVSFGLGCVLLIVFSIVNYLS